MKHVVERALYRILFGVLICVAVLCVPRDSFGDNTGYAGAPEDLHVYLLIGEENMCGGANFFIDAGGTIPGCLLLNREDVWEPAENPMNRYSSLITQLNTQNLNPGYTFAKALIENAPSNTIGLVVNALRNTPIAQWRKGAGTDYYEEALRRVQIAITNGTFKGILWQQGESDTSNTNYLNELEGLVNEFRLDLGDSNLPFVAGQITTNGATSLVNSQIAGLTNRLAYTGVASSLDLGPSDGVVFSSNSVSVLGQRFAASMMTIQGVTPGPGVGEPLVHAEPTTYTGAKEDLHVYLLIGQSNMAGRAPYTVAEGGLMERCWLLNTKDNWEHAKAPLNRYASIIDRLDSNMLNPGYGFALKMATNNPAISIGLVSNARGGTSIMNWLPGSRYYNEALRRVNAARVTGTLKGILWHQGESDAGDLQYIEKLEILVKSLRRDLGVPDLPFIAGQINDNPLINDQIAQLPDRISFTDYTSSEGLTGGLHFDMDSMKLLGWRYDDAMELIIDNPASPLITAQPQDRTETLAQTATFRVIVTGTAPFYYQWRRDGVDIGGATSAIYTTAPVAIEDEGARFSVVVSNSATNVISIEATLSTSLDPQPPTDTLLAHWKMDDAAGVFAADDSGNDNDLWIKSSVGWTTGQVDGAMLSINSFTRGELNDVLDMGAEHTVAGWFTAPLFPGVYYNHLAADTNGNSFLSFRDSMLGLRASGSFSGCGYDVTGLSTGWHHVASVATGTVTKFYVDGAFVGSVPVKVTSEIAYIGNNNGGATFSPAIDDVRVYGRALNAVEIAALAAMGTTPAPTGYTITGSAGLGGIINPNGDVIVPDGGSQSFVITESVGYEIDDVLVNSVSVGSVSNYPFTNVTTNHTIVASFSLIPDSENPTVPQNLVAVAASGVQVDLTWNASTDNIGVAGYEIRRDGALIDTAVGTNYSDVGLSPETIYAYTVAAVDAQGNQSGESSSTGVITPAVQDLLAHWMFDETSGLIASDATGNGYDADLNNAGQLWTTNGYIDGALSCSDRYDRMNVDPALDIGVEHTVAGWFTMPLFPGLFYNHLFADSAGNGLLTYMAGSSSLGVRSGPTFYGCGYDISVLSNGWHHVAAVGSGTTTEFYVDGVSVGTSSANVITEIGGIGDSVGGGSLFSYTIDDLRVYGRALSAAEIAALAGGTVETDTDGDGIPDNVDTDDDGDGMPDDWESDNGFDSLDADDAGLDPDGDGFSNLEEYICDTDPADPTAKLETGNLTIVGAGVDLSFDTALGRRYEVEYKDDLLAVTWSSLTNNIQGTDGTVNVNDPALVGRRFYRIRVRLEE